MAFGFPVSPRVGPTESDAESCVRRCCRARSAGVRSVRGALSGGGGGPRVGDEGVSRRSVAAAALAAAVAAVLPVPPVRADRTGKYSTKLTARRRYLPRIKGAFEALEAVENGGLATASLDPVDEEDLRAAMELFGSSYFAEGNRIGATEKKLKDISERLYQDLRQAKVSLKKGNIESASTTFQKAMKELRDYKATAKLDEILPA